MKKFKKVLNDIFYYIIFALCCVIVSVMVVWKAFIYNFVDFVINTAKDTYCDIKDIFVSIKEDRKQQDKEDSKDETEE